MLSIGILDFGCCKDCEVIDMFSTLTAQAVEVYIVQLIVSEGEQTKRSKCSQASICDSCRQKKYLQ